MSTTIYLVHGTLAREAPWTQPGSALRNAIESVAPTGEISFEPVGWSGSNLHSHRIKAASDLSSRLDAERLRDPTRKLIVVGHSHGGTIISLMLSKHPAVAGYLKGAVFLSTPFIVASRRPHTDGLKGVSEYVLPMLDAIASLLVMLALLLLLTFTGTFFAWVAPAVSMSWILLMYATAGKLTHTRLPGVSVKLWLANWIALNLSILLTAAFSALSYGALKSAGLHSAVAFCAAGAAFVAIAVGAWRLLRRFNLLQPTVGEVSHITTSISRLLDDFKQSTLPSHRALIIRFTSDEASLLLSLAQATVKLIDFFVKSITAFFTLFSFEFWRAARKRLGIVDRLAWLGMLAAFLVLFSHTFLMLVSGTVGLLFAAVESIADAIVHVRVPEIWNFSRSLPIRFFEWLEPSLAWSIDFSTGRYTTNPLVLAIAVVVGSLTAASLVLSLPFGATSFWGSLYVSFSVESAPVGNCQVVTFTPSSTDTDFWSESPLAHSLAYTDPRSLDILRDRVAQWIGGCTEDAESIIPAVADAA